MTLEVLCSLPAKQQVAVLAIAQGASHADAAKASGLSPDTVSFYSGQPKFKSALAEVLRTTADAHLARMAASGGEAVSVLLDLMRNSKADAIRLRAATAVIDLLRDKVEEQRPTPGASISAAQILSTLTLPQ